MPSLPILIAVSTVGEQLFGLALGFIPVAMQYEADMMNCTAYTQPFACHSVERAACVWHNGECAFSDYATVRCGNYTDPVACQAVPGSACYFQEGACMHVAGWTPSQQGLFAAAAVFGAMASSTFATQVMDKIGRKKTMKIAAVVALFGQALTSTAWGVDSFPLLVAARVVAGLAIGFATCVCPTYVGEMAPESYVGALGALFQTNYTFAVAFIALVGFLLNPKSFRDSHVSMVGLFQLLTVPAWLSGVATLALGFRMPESTVWMDGITREDIQAHNEAVAAAGGGSFAGGGAQFYFDDPLDANVNSPPRHRAIPDGSARRSRQHSRLSDAAAASHGSADGVNLCPVVIADAPVSRATLVRCVVFTVTMGIAIQCTGNSAMLSYAPTIMHDAVGLDPFLGNFVVAAFNFLLTFCGIVASRKIVQPVTAYTFGTTLVAGACVLVGVASYPGIIASAGAQRGVASAGIVVFVAAFQTFVGCFYYVIAQSVFPGKYRSMGCAIANLTQFLGQLLTFFTFPLAVEALSGGPSANQQKGLGIVFFAFAVIAVVCVVAMRLLRPTHFIATPACVVLPEAEAREAFEGGTYDVVVAHADVAPSTAAAGLDVVVGADRVSPDASVALHDDAPADHHMVGASAPDSHRPGQSLRSRPPSHLYSPLLGPQGASSPPVMVPAFAVPGATPSLPIRMPSRFVQAPAFATSVNHSFVFQPGAAGSYVVATPLLPHRRGAGSTLSPDRSVADAATPGNSVPVPAFVFRSPPPPRNPPAQAQPQQDDPQHLST